MYLSLIWHCVFLAVVLIGMQQLSQDIVKHSLYSFHFVIKKQSPVYFAWQIYTMAIFPQCIKNLNFYVISITEGDIITININY